MKSILFSVAVGMATIIQASAAHAECASDKAVAAYVADYSSRTPTKVLAADGTMADALCTQKKLVQALSGELGPVVGYKAALTSKAAQEKFKAEEPIRGTLLRDMLLEDGAEVPASFGVLPLFEADLLLVVGDTAINDAKTAEEVMQSISAVRPFIELPDITAAKGEPLTPVTLTAINVAARFGVMGAPIAVDDDAAAMLKALEQMAVTVRDANGETLAESTGAAVLGNPVNSVLWLRSNGVEFKVGDVISVGSIGPFLPVAKAKGGVTVRYSGLPGDPSVSMHFK